LKCKGFLARLLQDCYTIDEKDRPKCIIKEGFHTVLIKIILCQDLEDLASYFNELSDQIYKDEYSDEIYEHQDQNQDQSEERQSQMEDYEYEEYKKNSFQQIVL
jgi:hypothetical protein